MARTIISKSILIACVSLISLISISKCDPLITQTINQGFTVDLIHRDSPQSPSYNPSLSHYQRLANALRRSFNRVHRFNPDRSKRSPKPDLINSNGEYLLKFSIGTPPVPSLAIADTGSDIIWTQCKPCLECFKQKLPLFEPKASSSYKTIACNTTKCGSLRETYCGTSRRKSCLYSESYGDGSFTYGELATDTITLSSSGKRVVSVPNITLGCGFNNSGVFDGGESGIIGLGGGRASLVRQLGHLVKGKFSYCLVQASSSNNNNISNSGKLNFGAKARVSGEGVVRTPLVRKDPETFYYMTLEGISVGDERLEFYDEEDTSVRAPEGNVIIDSGTTLTLLPWNLYGKYVEAIKSVIKLKQVEDPLKLLELCYYSREDDDIEAPQVTVHFRGGDVKWKRENAFVRTGNVSLCLAAQPQLFGPGIYGNLAQIDFLVGYDLVKGRVSFKPTDCTKS